MSKNKIYILASALFVAGLLIGWFLKPQSDTQMTEHTHVQNESESSTDGEIWTCSMHPQIRQNEPGICPICEMDLIPLDNSMDNDDPTILKMSKEAAKLAQIETFQIPNTSGNSSNPQAPISVEGTIELDESTIKSQTAHLSGRIESMHINFEGQYVSKGQKIASIYSTELLEASQELITANKYNDRVNGIKDAAVQKLKNWKISDEAIQNIIDTNEPMETIDIYADHGGYVMRKILSQGDYVKQGQSLYTLGSINSVWLVFNVFESDIAHVKIGDEVNFSTPSLVNQEFKSRVSYIEPLLNSTSRTATVRANFNNGLKKLKPGMLLEGSIQPKFRTSRASENKISIPNSAILWTGKKSVVYVQLEENEVPTYQYREVTIENRGNNYSMVSTGLKAGELVVMHGAFSIDAAAQLSNKMSMMNKNVQIKKENNEGIIPSFADETSPDFKNQLDAVVEQYLSLKDALVLTNANQASLETDLLLKTLQNVDMSLLKGESHEYWMTQLRAMEGHGTKIKNSPDVEEQRSQFDFLSQAMINSIKAFGSNGNIYYVQYCPMVKGNQGADWIAKEKDIRNPYFGDKMMKCGLVKLELN